MDKAELAALKKYCDSVPCSMAAYVKILLKTYCPALNGNKPHNIVGVPPTAQGMSAIELFQAGFIDADEYERRKILSL
jgi:hypothetical protein